MDLLDRYRHAVGFWLPKAQRQDIVSELSEDIRSQIEEQESGLGRPLTAMEVEALLVRVGRPALVASHYLPQRYLIGPALFPIYLFVLKIVAAVYMVPILIRIGLTFFSPSYQASHGGWFQALGVIWGGFWTMALVAIGIVTVVFATLERGASTSKRLGTWSPRTLPPVRDPNRIPRGTSILEIVANIVFASWWVMAMASPVVVDRPDLRIVLAPAWVYFFWSYLLLAAANVALAGSNLLQPNWTRTKAGVRLMTNLCGSVLFASLCGSNVLQSVGLDVASWPASGDIAASINLWLARALPFAIGVGLLVLAVDVRRLVRARAA